MVHGPGRGIDKQVLEVEGLELVSAWLRPSQRGSLTLRKAPRLVDAYRDLLTAHPQPNLVELGIAQGGSVALLALLARPRQMVALELADEPVEALLATLADLGLAEVVTTHFGVDQADRARLREILIAAFGEEPLDVVIDDASHEYLPTLASFEELFPRLRPGGVYVVEDWSCNDQLGAILIAAADDVDDEVRARYEDVVSGRVPQRQLLSRLVLEAVMAQAQSPDAVARVVVQEDWTEIHRGDAALDPATFRLTDLYQDVHGLGPP